MTDSGFKVIEALKKQRKRIRFKRKYLVSSEKKTFETPSKTVHEQGIIKYWAINISRVIAALRFLKRQNI